MHFEPKLMGVMNVTPNSFSDGGKYLQAPALRAQWSFLASHCQIIDLGAESTAPMNSPIGPEEEIARLQAALLALEGLEGPHAPGRISVDTYRPTTMRWAARELPKRFPKAQVVWNDVSGIVDQELLDFFGDFPECGYVLCHNRSPRREVGARHMQFALLDDGGDIAAEVEAFFRGRLKALAPLKLPWLALDPCLGLSKSAEENWALLKAMPRLMRAFPEHEWLLGLSRKSFLRKSAAEGIDPYKHAQHLETLVAKDLWNQGVRPWFRVHDPTGLKALAVYSSSCALYSLPALGVSC